MTYEYLCTGCGHQWEAEQSISADPLTDCPECKAPKAQRQISGGTGFVLKGSGWYADLYSSSKPKKSDESSSGESKSDAGEASGSKVEAKSDSSDGGKAKPSKPSGDGKKKSTKAA